ncbi:MAG: TonB-dependent receptor [Candidatus Aceula meridiana]|nr:TonB-dependent receptor [Candidatus Aceula meridiana]
MPKYIYILCIGLAVFFCLISSDVFASNYQGGYLPSREIAKNKAVNQMLDGVEGLNQKKSYSTLAVTSTHSVVVPKREGMGIKPVYEREKYKKEMIKNDLDWIEFQFNMNSGMRYDYLRWSIAGDTNGQNPNILSELTWSDLWIYQIGTEAKVILNKNFRLEGSFDYGWILNGENQDSDYYLDDRGWEFSRSNNTSNGDNVMDFSLGGGLQFQVGAIEGWEDFLTEDLGVAVLGGYSHHEQNLRMTDGSQTIPASGGFDGLDSTYQSRWTGPWAGIELFGSREKFKGFSRFEYHWADYYAEADWNLRSDFQHPVSYIHETKGTGMVISFGAEYEVNDSWTAGITGDLNFWKADKGLDRVYFSNGAVVDTQLNEVIWRSYALMLSATYRFGGE